MVTDETSNDDGIPEGAAVFPLIPAELGIDPILLSTLHAVVFLVGSQEDVVHGAAAEEALQYMMSYLHRVDGNAKARLQEDFQVLINFARQDGWPKQDIHFLKTIMADFGVGKSKKSEEQE